jgi:prepilin peptidase CpaA
MDNELIIPAMVLLTAGLACVTDLRTRRIPNALTFGSALAGFLYHAVSAGTSGAGSSVAGWLVGTIVFLPFFALRGMGGGDVKLLAALGAWLGPREALWLAAYSMIAGGVIAVAVSLARGYLGTALSNIGSMLSYWRTSGLKPVPDLTLDSTSPKLAYAVPILAGLVVTLWR